MIPSVLEWIPILISCLNSALETINGYSVSKIENLSSKIVISIKEPINNKNCVLVRNLCNYFCRANQGFLKSLTFAPDKIELLVYVKYKNGPSLKIDPFVKEQHDKRTKKKNAHVSRSVNTAENIHLSGKDFIQIHNSNSSNLDNLLGTTSKV